jgi:hypothetical protein
MIAQNQPNINHQPALQPPSQPPHDCNGRWPNADYVTSNPYFFILKKKEGSSFCIDSQISIHIQDSAIETRTKITKEGKVEQDHRTCRLKKSRRMARRGGRTRRIRFPVPAADSGSGIGHREEMGRRRAFGFLSRFEPPQTRPVASPSREVRDRVLAFCSSSPSSRLIGGGQK